MHVIVSGEVQGVGYRYTMRMVARDEGVSGWVRNREDGSVEAEFSGTAAQVDAVLAWMAEGPPGSRVTDARVSDARVSDAAGPAPLPVPFEVRPTV